MFEKAHKIESIRKDNAEINWPTFDENQIKEDFSKIVIQINGRKRGLIDAKLDLLEEDLIKLINNECDFEDIEKKYISILNDPNTIMHAIKYK